MAVLSSTAKTLVKINTILADSGITNRHPRCSIPKKIPEMNPFCLLNDPASGLFFHQIEHQNIRIRMRFKGFLNHFHIVITITQIIIREQANISICPHKRIVSIQSHATLGKVQISYMVSIPLKVLYFITITLIRDNHITVNVHFFQQ